MRRPSLISVLCVFPDDGSTTVLFDRTEVTYTRRTRSMEPRLTRPALRSTTDLGLPYDVRLLHRDTRESWEMCWRCAGVKYKLCVPKYRTRGLYTIQLRIDFNPLRMLRAQLSPRERNLHRGPADRKDNMLDPRVVPPEEAHRRVTELVPCVVLEGRRDFIAIVLGLFGGTVEEHEVIITPSQVEFAWDRACDASNTAIHGILAAWLATIPRSRKRYRIGREDADPSVELWGEGVLKASFRRGWILKLYALPSAALRFENQLTARVIREILGRRLCLIDQTRLRADLAEISHAVYGPIVEVQRSMEPSRVPNVEQLLTALVPTNSEPLARLIAGQLVACGKVQCNRGTPSVYKVVLRMRARRLMRKSKERGYWEPMPSFALLLQAVVRQCIVLTGRTPRTSRRHGGARRLSLATAARSSTTRRLRVVTGTRATRTMPLKTARITASRSLYDHTKQRSAHAPSCGGARTSYTCIGATGPRTRRRHCRRSRKIPRAL